MEGLGETVLAGYEGGGWDWFGVRAVGCEGGEVVGLAFEGGV